MKCEAQVQILGAAAYHTVENAALSSQQYNMASVIIEQAVQIKVYTSKKYKRDTMGGLRE